MVVKPLRRHSQVLNSAFCKISNIEDFSFWRVPNIVLFFLFVGNISNLYFILFLIISKENIKTRFIFLLKFSYWFIVFIIAIVWGHTLGSWFHKMLTIIEPYLATVTAAPSDWLVLCWGLGGVSVRSVVCAYFVSEKFLQMLAEFWQNLADLDIFFAWLVI